MPCESPPGAVDADAPPRRRRWVRWLLLGLLALAAGAWWAVPPLLENFATVIPGCAYRSSQLSPAALGRRVAAYGLRSVINLRGRNPEHEWYWDERVAAARLGVRHYDIALDSRYPYADELREVIEILETCPKPVVFHCNSGVDRTGTVAAIAVLLLDEGGTLAKAERHFGLRYLQIPWRTNAVGQQKFFDLYREWLAQNHLAHSRATFRRWALRYYRRPANVPPTPE